MESATSTRSSNPLTVFLTSKAFILVLRVFLGGLFIFSSMDKVLDPGRFAVAVRAYKLLPVPLTNLFALTMAWSELVAGIMLLLGIGTRKAAGALLLLLVVFIGAIGATLVRGLVIDCGCFSNEGGGRVTYLLILRNLFLIAAALMIMRFERGYLGIGSMFAKRRLSRES